MIELEEDKSRPLLVIEPLQGRFVEEISRNIVSMDPWLTLGYSGEAVSRYLLRPDPALGRYALLLDGRLSGVLSVRNPWLFGPFIELIAVFGDRRRKGIGRKVIEWVRSQHAGALNLWVTVSSFNFDAQGFYARMGFECTTFLDDLIRPGFVEVLLRKRLSRAKGDAGKEKEKPGEPGGCGRHPFPRFPE